MNTHRCPECGCQCAETQEKLRLAIVALEGLDALYSAIIEAADEEGLTVPKPTGEGTA